MPLCPEPITLHGGCNCRAIRYTINIPEYGKRPFHPWATSHDQKDTKACRLPFTTWDHCNDCRTATGALLPAWICVPAEMMTLTCVVTDSLLEPSHEERHYQDADITVPTGKFSTSNDRGDASTAGCRITRPSLDILAPPFLGVSPAATTWIRYYGSSSMRTRSFCGRCGTNLAYNVRPMPKEWPDMIDVLLGTVDREDLEKLDADGMGMLEPERQLWWERGLPWLREAVWSLKGPKHEGPSPKEEIEHPKDQSKAFIKHE